MKKRHEQKLIILAIAALFVFNIPLLLVFNLEGSLFGFPILYAAIFGVWLLIIVISYVVLNRYYE